MHSVPLSKLMRLNLPWAGFVFRRLLTAVPTVLLVVILGFLVTRLAPGDPVMLLAGDQASDEYIAEVRARYGLDQPLIAQFGRYLMALLSGDFGYSFANKQSVLSLVWERLPPTLLLISASFFLALGLGVALALVSVKFLNSPIDRALSALSMAGYSVPVFWLAQILIYYFAVKFDMFPTGGMVNLRAPSSGVGRVIDIAHHLVLPAINLGLIYTALIARLARAEMAEVGTMDFVLTARSKGVSENRILICHILRNALSPILTMSGVVLGNVFAGAIFTETIFGWPGLGRMLYDALFSRDYPVITGMFLFISFSFVIVNLIVDFLYAVVDPRVRRE